MKKLNNGNLKLAIQKNGRLTEETVKLLRSAGLEFESYKQQLFSTCRNFPLTILYLRDDDIPDYVESGGVDIGIVGQNILKEKNADVKTLFPLNFGYCSLCLAVPKESKYTDAKQLSGAKIATTYPLSTQQYFKKKRIPVEIITISGSVEVVPALGLADAVVDLVSTGSTLALNDLAVIDTIYQSQATLIASTTLSTQPDKQIILNRLVTRLKGVLEAATFKYIMMNAPESILPKLKTVVPGLKSPTISPLATAGWISIQTVVKEDIFWETIEKLKNLGATGILVLPVEKLIV